jgi:hypothetical protein
MKMHCKLVCCVLSLLLASVGCNKKSETKEATAPAPAQPAATEAATAASTPAPESAPAAAASSNESAATAAETSFKTSAADWALKQDEIKNDPKGQWAIEATASSTYGDAKGTASYSPDQVLGPPNVDHYGDNTTSWVPKTEDSGIEWIDLKFPKPVHASEVRVRESCGSGAVIKVELFDEQGSGHSVWAGNDPTKDLNYLMVKFPKTTYKTARVKVTLATNVVPGWNEIDTVQLVGTEP